jgi:TrmH family RNA methyltransferase
MLSAVVIVLNRPQKLVNIAGVVRAMKNMGLRRLRLVDPAEYDARDIAGIAHRSDDLLGTTEIFRDLDAALADATTVVGTTARRHGERPPPATPRDLAPELIARAQLGTVAILFGPEDNGLSNADLDRCHMLLTIPTDPGYASLNLAQSALLVCYELRLAAGAGALPAGPQRGEPASGAQLEGFFEALEQALVDVELFKNAQRESKLRTLRSLTHRAQPTVREAALLRAIAYEISHFVRRMRAGRDR